VDSVNMVGAHQAAFTLIQINYTKKAITLGLGLIKPNMPDVNTC